MANRRMGGMGGGPRGNRSFSQQQFQGGSLNPWQGAMPQNSMNQGLLSQISSNPQQLALALSSLLQNQQQNPPSLLSLPTPPAFSNQGGDFNRFGNRGNRDFRRHEPYNKNRNFGGRNNDNRRRGNQNQQKQDDQKKTPSKKEDKVLEVSTDDGGEEKTPKRDWKDEKNASEEKKNESSEEERNKDGVYAGIPKEYLNCFVCNKQMWDGESMYKHVKGRAHRQTLETLEESIHITVNILRENMRLLEEKKVIELERMQRLSKKFKYQEQESHCNMCDLKFLGKIISHRKSEGHQRLKRYLHPVCNLCAKEFPSRVEWIEHRLTPEHLKNLFEKMKDRCGGADGDIIVKEDEQELALEPLLDEPLQMEDEYVILELTNDLSSYQNLLPAYKPDRAVSTKSLVEFSGFRCELCNRSFENEELAQKHLKTRGHYHAFIEAIKRKYKEQQKAKESKKVEDDGDKPKEENDESQADGDQEMYDPEEATNEDESAVDAETTQEEGEGDPSVINNSVDMIEMVEEEEAEPEEEEEMPEPPPPPKKQEVKKEPPKPVTSTPKQAAAPAKAAPAAAPAKAAPAAAPAKAAAAATPAAGGVKNGAGPKSKKARKQ
nr:zinc finger protein on ecdysone puffs isoform X1 [Leptinotarsa decemlineata]